MGFLNSVKALYAAVGILFLTVGLGYYVDTKNEEVNVRHIEINTNLEKIARLNKELTNILTIALLERNALRTASYNTVNNDLEQSFKAVVKLTQTQNLLQEISALSDGHARFHPIEGKVIELMSADKWDEARSILFGDEYVFAKKTYELDCEMAAIAVTGELSAQAQRFSRIKTFSLGLRIGSLLLLLWVGVMFSRKTRADLSEQVRLRKEITVAYEGMEDRVLERTAELEETGKRLATENEERLRSDARTRLILNSAGEGIFGVDAEGRVTFFNDAAAKLLGYAADEITGREIYGAILHSRADGTPYQREDTPMFQAVANGEQGHVSGETLWRKDGSMFLSEYSVTPISDGKGGMAGAVMVFRDITRRKRNEEELEHRLDELERFNRLTIGREERMIQLKLEINSLLEETGRDKKYKAVNE